MFKLFLFFNLKSVIIKISNISFTQCYSVLFMTTVLFMTKLKIADSRNY